jgi:hypothetical protein
LHSLDSPQTSSEHDVLAQVVETFDRNGFEHGQKAVSDIGFFILRISEKNLKADLGLIEFKLGSLEGNEYFFFPGWDCAIIVLDISDFFICDFAQDIFVDFGIHFYQFVLDEFVDS